MKYIIFTLIVISQLVLMVRCLPQLPSPTGQIPSQLPASFPGGQTPPAAAGSNPFSSIPGLPCPSLPTNGANAANAANPASDLIEFLNPLNPSNPFNSFLQEMQNAVRSALPMFPPNPFQPPH
ncbi:uncharacterized protein LOC116349017 [Contarinia nasturtii]|uniref:uncharacterized protein LOC116349017 n=1 Tax=Contarinia nasturtii TaxID=265458 RepID=UPI0012D3E311|nr:uncharacterized protein LOC116349017 [Contarinia nasturtii]